MKKIYSIVLMATALLIGTNVKAATSVGSLSALKTAVATAGAEIELTANIAVNENLDFNGAVITTSSDNKKHLTMSAASEVTWSNLTFKDAPSYAIYMVTKAGTLNLVNVKVNTTASYAVYLNIAGAKLTLDANSEITGYTYAVNAAKKATVENKGKLNGTTTAAITLPALSSLTNEGTIVSAKGYGAIVKGASTLTNKGTITGTTGAIQATGAATVTNEGTLTGTAASKCYGVYLSGKGASFTNKGEISAATYPIYVLESVTVVNEAAGSFSNSKAIGLSKAGQLNFTNSANIEYSIIPVSASNDSAQTIVNNAGTLKYQTSGSYSFNAKSTITNAGTLRLANGLNGDLEVNNTGTAEITAGIYKGAIAVTGTPMAVSGGTFNSETAPEGLSISAGSFAQDVTSQLASAEVVCTQNLAGAWVVRDANDNAVASVNGVKYNYLDAAFNAAQDGETIVLESDVNLDFPVIITALKAEDSRALTLDLNGYSISTTSVKDIICIFKGSLVITGTGSINNNSGLNHATGVYMIGYDQPMDADKVWSYLKVDKNVRITSDYLGVYVYTLVTTKGTKYNAYGYDGYFTASGYADANHLIDWEATDAAYGVDVDIYGYVYGHDNGMNVTGLVKALKADDENSTHIPYVHIHDGATVAAHATDAACAGVYMSGNAIWVIDEATITGANGIYAKGGELTLNGTTVSATGPYAEPEYSRSGIDGSNGNAIVYDTNYGYTMNLQLTINDANVSAEHGYAILEAITSPGETESKMEAEDFQINGGTFNGGDNPDAGCLELTATLGEDVKVNGSITGGTFNADITEYLDETQGVVVPVQDEEGNVVYAVVDAPDDGWKDNLLTATADDAIRLNSDAVTVINVENNITCDLLYMVGKDKVIIKAGATLTVNELMMGADAVVEIEAGARLLVLKDGVISNQIANIVIDADATTEKVGELLLAPEVFANVNPKATVKFVTKSYRKSASDKAYQRFGIPVKELESIDCGTVQAAIYNYSYTSNKWNMLGILNGTPALDITALKHNEYYEMLVNAANPGTVFSFSGRLAGNSNTDLNFVANDFVGFANSYTAGLNITNLVASLTGDIQQAVYVYESNSATNYGWQPYSGGDFADEGDPEFIPAMQAFIIYNDGAETSSVLNYEEMVYNPALGINPNLAPARRRTNSANMTSVNIIVEGAEFGDKVRVFEDTKFSAAFDKGEAVKYMNSDLNVYITDDKKMSIFATDNLNNSYVGISTVTGGHFTMSFRNVNGDNLTLVDLVNGNRIAIIEGETYEFEAEANSTNDHRFQIISVKGTPTGIDNVSAANNGVVYTITGQRVGNMSEWDILPAGIYVVDGEKRVK